MAICERKLTSFAAALTASTVVVGALALTQVPAAGQAAKAPARVLASAKTWTPPHTPDGHPDLSGLWNDRTSTPLQRDRSLGTKEFYSDQEFAEAAARVKQGEPLVPGRGRGTGNPAPAEADGTPANAAAGRGARAGNYVAPNPEIYDRTVYGYDTKSDPLVSTKRTSLIVGPDGRIPPPLPEAVKRNADRAAALRGHEFDSYEYRNLEERCILSNLERIPMLPAQDINTNLQIFQGANNVVIYQEISHDTRVIPTDGRAHIAKSIRQLQGDSVGHWEGDTLVVDTTNFTDRTFWQASGEDLHLVERFKLIAADVLLYQFTVEDPKTWAKPWTVEITWNRRNNEPLYEYACQEGNGAVRLILAGARKQEADAARIKGAQ